MYTSEAPLGKKMVMQRPNVNESPAMRANRAIGSLKNLKGALNIIDAGLVMALEGQTRASAADIAARAAKDFEGNFTASDVGQFLRSVGISGAVIHGKPRLVLDAGQLKALKDRMSKACNETAVELESTLKEFAGVSAIIAKLEEQWNETVRMRMRERELARQIQQDRATPSKLPYLEQEAARFQKEADQVAEIEKRCKELSEKIKTLPALQEKQKSLEMTAAKYRGWEREIAENEARLGQALEELKKRSAWATFLDLQYNINKQKAELAQITAQINERRPLLQKVLGSNKLK
jgi:hypothetical protein